MVVINLERPPENLEVFLSSVSNIAKRAVEARQRLEREKRIQEIVSGARAEGKEITTTLDPKTGRIGGVSIKDVLKPPPSIFGGAARKAPTTGTAAVRVGGEPTINLQQALGGGLPGVAGAADVPTIQPSRALAPAIDPLQGLLVPEKITEKRLGITTVAERRPLETELERTGERKAQESLRSFQIKDAEKRKVNLRSVKLKLGNSLRSFVDVSRRTEKLTGVKPGPLGGSLSALLGATKANEFVRGFIGGLTEVAAAVGATAIPNARAVRLVSLFKGAGIGRFDTIESGVQTTADSLVNSMSTDMGSTPWEYIFGNLPTERQAKAEWDKLTRNEQTGIFDNVLPKMLEDFEDQFVKQSLDTIFDADPQLLGTETIQRIEAERQLQRNTFTTPSGISFTIGQ